jgi:DNA polymerase-4
VSTPAVHRRTILHVDMDAFFAAVEVLDDPSLAGRPLIVGGEGERGVVASCSYEARIHGVRSAMPSVRARRQCPDAVFRPGRHDRYQEVSRSLHEIFRRFTPLVEGISLDEAFLDVTGAQRLFGPGPHIAAVVRHAIATEVGLCCSVGVAPTKFLAKLASEAAKPLADHRGIRPGSGVVVVAAGEELGFLHPLPIEALWGVGPATSERLRRLGVATVGQLAAAPVAVLEAAVGRAAGRHLHELGLGIDPRPVEPDRPVRSVGHEETYIADRYDRDGLHLDLVRMSDAVASRLRCAGVAGRTVQLKLRDGDFRTRTRSRTGPTPLDSGRTITRVAAALLDNIEIDRGVRLLGVSVAGLEPAGAVPAVQLGLGLDSPGAGEAPDAAAVEERDPVAAERWAAATSAVDAVRQRFGARAVGPAALVDDRGLRIGRDGDNRWDAVESGASDRP